VFAHNGDRIIDAKGIRTIKAMNGDDRPLYPVVDSEIQEAVDFIEGNRSNYEVV